MAPCVFSYFFLPVFFHSGAIPPLVVKTRGLNEDFLMSMTLWLYLSFSISCCGMSLLRTSQNKTEVGCVILTSKKVFSQLFHSPLAEISNLALSAVLTFLSKSFSLIGRSVGSV